MNHLPSTVWPLHRDGSVGHVRTWERGLEVAVYAAHVETGADGSFIRLSRNDARMLARRLTQALEASA